MSDQEKLTEAKDAKVDLPPALTDPNTGRRCTCACHRDPDAVHVTVCCS